MPSPSDDRLRDTLVALRGDLDRAPLADPAAVRRRGQQRARHQGIAVAAAAVAVVAVVVGGSLGLVGRDEATTIPAHPTPTSVNRTVVPEPFLRAADVGSVGPYESFRRSPDPVSSGDTPLQCVASPTTLGAGVTLSARYFSDLDAGFLEHVLQFSDDATAAAAVDRLTGQFARCPEGDPAQDSVLDIGPTRSPGTGDVDEVAHASRLSTPTVASEPFYYELGVARAGNVVVVLQWTSQGNPFSGPGRLVWTESLLTTAAQRAIA